MKDTSLYQQILGDTSPWSVGNVELNAEKLTIEVRMVLPPVTVWGCVKCNCRMHVKEWRERRWRHMDSCQFKTILVASVPVVECPEHGAQTVQVPWAEGSSRYTLLFERFAIEVLLACNTERAGELLDITWDQADGIKQRAVIRGMAKRPALDIEYVCVDEKAVGHGHDYVTIVTGLVDRKQAVLYVGDGKGEQGLNGFWEQLGPEGCKRIKAISMDMGKSYIKSALKYCPNAELIFDPFHIMKMINEAVNEVRRQEVVMGSGKDRIMLKKTQHLWLWGEENLPQRYADRFDELKESTLKTARAWRIKELWRTFKNCVDMADGVSFFKKWYRVAMVSKLEPMKKVAHSLQKHLSGIVAYLKHGFCNAIAESMNSRIQLLVQKACGYRNRERLKTDIMFNFGGLDLNPVFVQ
jgi:transposase